MQKTQFRTPVRTEVNFRDGKPHNSTVLSCRHVLWGYKPATPPEGEPDPKVWCRKCELGLPPDLDQGLDMSQQATRAIDAFRTPTWFGYVSRGGRSQIATRLDCGHLLRGFKPKIIPHKGEQCPKVWCIKCETGMPIDKA
jgi:hypothetical protein